MRPAPLRTAPVYDRQKALGAQFGCVNGWERPNYYGPLDAPEGFDHDARSFRRGGWWEHARAEAEAIRNGVGLIDATAFTKHLVRGPGATEFLDRFTTNRLPRVGRINLTYALTEAGTTRTEYTLVRLAENAYYCVSAGAWTAYDADYLLKAAEDFMAAGGAYVDIHDVTTQWGVFAIAGPKSRTCCARSSRMPTPRRCSATSASRGSRCARSSWACARSARSAWPIPASWDGSCITRSRCRPTSGIS